MVDDFFSDVTEPIPFGGLESTDPLSFKVYEPDRLVLGKRMEDHLRPGVCFWHSFAWPGVDMFGSGTMDRPWLDGATDEMAAARTKMAVAFEFFTKLGIPYYCFHDRDVAPEGASFATFRSNLDALTDDAAGYQERTGVRLLWGTANLFTHPRYQAGAATNPDPEVFAFAAAQVKHMLEVTKRLGGENYVLWGGREGYDTLLNTDLRREGAQLARFLHLVAEHKHRIGFAGQLLIEPKPMEPTKHQYDYDVGDGPRLPRQATGSRASTASTSRRTTRRSRVTASTTRSPSRSRTASSAASTRTGATRRTAGTPTSSPTRSTISRCRSTRSSGTAASRPAGSTSTPSSVARARTGRDLFHAHIGAHRHARAGAPRRGRPGRARRARRSQGATLRRHGTARSARAILDGTRDARHARGEGRGRRRSTRGRLGPPGAARERRQPVRLGCGSGTGEVGHRPLTRWPTSSGSTPRRPRPRPSSSTRPGAVVGVGRLGVRTSRCRGRSGASRHPTCGGTAPSRSIRSVLASSGVDRRRRRRDRADRADARPGAARPGRPRPPACDPVERPADRRRVRRDPRRSSARNGSSRSPGNDALTGFTAPKLVWVRDHEPDDLGTGRARPAAEGLRPAPSHGRARARQGRRRRARSCSTSPPATGRRRSSPPSGSILPGCRRPSKDP